MGFAFWILQEVGFELRRFGLLMARLTWWLMVVGVGGILVSTIVMHFAGSWVFLYPIPFHSAGQWGKWATAIFLSSVLLVGLSIVTWCLSIIDTVIGPGLHAVSTNIFNRLGVAMGFGYLWPKRFATNPEPVPYVVIPLTVIAIDMVIATLPLAVLLVEMIIETFAPSVHVERRCWRRTCSGGSATRSSTCCSSRRSRSTTTSSRRWRTASSSRAT